MTEAPCVAILRPEGKLAEARQILEGRGFRVVAAPMLEVRDHADPRFKRVLDDLGEGRVGHVVVTSTTAVDRALAQADQLLGEGGLAHLLREVPVVAIGPRTAAALEEAGVPVHAVPATHSSAGVVRWFRDRGDRRGLVVLLRSTRGSAELDLGLREAGRDVLDVPVYDLARPALDAPQVELLDALVAGEVDAVVFSSSLIARHLLEMAEARGALDAVTGALRDLVVVALGEPTRRTLEEAGVAADLVPGEATFEAVADALATRLPADRPA